MAESMVALFSAAKAGATAAGTWMAGAGAAAPALAGLSAITSLVEGSIAAGQAEAQARSMSLDARREFAAGRLAAADALEAGNRIAAFNTVSAASSGLGFSGSAATASAQALAAAQKDAGAALLEGRILSNVRKQQEANAREDARGSLLLGVMGAGRTIFRARQRAVERG